MHWGSHVEVPNRQYISCLDGSLVRAPNFSSEDVTSGRWFESRRMQHLYDVLLFALGGVGCSNQRIEMTLVKSLYTPFFFQVCTF